MGVFFWLVILIVVIVIEWVFYFYSYNRRFLMREFKVLNVRIVNVKGRRKKVWFYIESFYVFV